MYACMCIAVDLCVVVCTHVCIGSLAGSASLITGSLGRTLAVLSFDKSYRKVGDCYVFSHYTLSM